jgi:hypothetical protein
LPTFYISAAEALYHSVAVAARGLYTELNCLLQTIVSHTHTHTHTQTLYDFKIVILYFKLKRDFKWGGGCYLSVRTLSQVLTAEIC